MPIISHESVSRYGWHIPELGKIITVNLAFTRTVELMGCRENAKTIDLSDVLPEEVEGKVKEAAEISEEDIINIKNLCQQVRIDRDFLCS